jgi:tetratricopeptide (TPR) repeat protein
MAAQTADYDQGIELFQERQFAAAAVAFERAARAHPNDAQTWKALGVAYAEQEKYGDAEEPFRRACWIDPRLEDACYFYSRSLYVLDRYRQSLDVLKEALSHEPDSWKYYLGMARAQEALGDATEAEASFRRALVLSRRADPRPGVSLGLFLERCGRFDEAIPPLEEVLTRFPDSADAHIYLGRALLEQNKTAQAIPHLESGVALAPESPQAHLLLAKAYVRAGRGTEAQPHFEAAARYEALKQAAR